MSQWDFAVNFFVALFALIDPIGNVPLFAAATNGVKSKDARLISVYIALFVLGFLTFFYFSGLSLLEFFGISLPAFRIAGGVILFLLGLEMARDDFTATIDALAGHRLGLDGFVDGAIGLDALPARFAELLAGAEGGKVVVAP